MRKVELNTTNNTGLTAGKSLPTVVLAEIPQMDGETAGLTEGEASDPSSLQQ